MKETGARALMYALLAVTSLQFTNQVGAVDIIYYPDSNGCVSSALGCYDVDADVCCTGITGEGGSLLLNNAGSTVLSQVFGGGDCTTLEGIAYSDVCYYGTQLTGAFWYYDSRRRSLLASSTKCTSQMKPNSVFFTEDSTKGHWVLTTSDADELYSQMLTVPDAGKQNWLKSLGAIYSKRSV